MSTFSMHNNLPNEGRISILSELRQDGVLVWLLKESTASLISNLSGMPSRKSDIRRRNIKERLALYVLALVDIGVQETLPDLVALTVNLREKETIGTALNGLRAAFRDRGLNSNFHYAGVEVPEVQSVNLPEARVVSHKHAHLFILGIHPGTEEWKVLLNWKNGRNKRMSRSVLQKWSYSPAGWLCYLYKRKNLGVPGAKVRHSTGKLNTAANDLSQNGLASFIERYEAYKAN